MKGDDKTMSALILDCSATISWLMPDETSEQSNFLLNMVTEKGALVPSLWKLEVGNVLLMAQRRNRISIVERIMIIHDLEKLPILIDTETVHYTWTETFALAEKFKLTLYDAAYLELAIRCDLPLATFDVALAKAAKTTKVFLEI